jgi:class 3 adenylate cyclase
MAERQRASLLYRILSLPLRVKISIPYLVAATLLAALAIFQVSRSFTTTLQTRLRSQLADAAARVAAGLVTLEDEQLSHLRTIAFTLGTAEAAAAGDAAALERLIFPLVVNNGLAHVDLLGADGTLLASWHNAGAPGTYEPAAGVGLGEWEIVQRVMNGEQDDLGDKFAAWIETPWGWVLYTAGPLQTADGSLIGIVLVGTSIQAVAARLQEASIADVTLYVPAGSAAATTIGEAADLNLGDNGVAASTDTTPLRTISVGGRGYFETLDFLYLRGEPTGWALGTALPESLISEVQGPDLWQLLFLFLVGILMLIGVGILVTQLISQPVTRLVNATEQVSAGDLEHKVEIFAEDEIGILTKGFNHMVDELKQREFIREIFGRMVSNEVREAVLTGQVALGGELREVTVLFTDIRGFTSMAEKIAPDAVIAVLNDYFEVIARATKRHGGLINRFGGDSALIIFGAPIARPQRESVGQAVLAAIEIRTGVAELNAQRIAAGEEPIRFGIGINSGEVVAGNLGSEDRFEYTVIGDVVNVAARLQGLTRELEKTPVLITSESLAGAVDEIPAHFLDLGNFELRGKERLVGVSAILEPARLPEKLTVFDRLPVRRVDALLICHLYCLGHSPETIAETLQEALKNVEKTIRAARTHHQIVRQALMDGFGLPPLKAARLTASDGAA